MKKLITALLLLCVTIGFAQSQDAKDKVLTEVTDDVCKCINDEDVSKLSSKEMEIKLGLCIVKAYTKNKKALDKHYNISFTDERSMEAFGEEIGIKMLEVCPETLLAVAQDYIGAEENEEATIIEPVKDDVMTSSGKIVKLTEGQFNIITFQDENKRKHKLLWMEYFQGQELLSDLKSLKKKNVQVSYEEKEMYDPKLEDYRTYKIIKGIQVK